MLEDRGKIFSGEGSRRAFGWSQPSTRSLRSPSRQARPSRSRRSAGISSHGGGGVGSGVLHSRVSSTFVLGRRHVLAHPVSHARGGLRCGAVLQTLWGLHPPAACASRRTRLRREEASRQGKRVSLSRMRGTPTPRRGSPRGKIQERQVLTAFPAVGTRLRHAIPEIFRRLHSAHAVGWTTPVRAAAPSGLGRRTSPSFQARSAYVVA